MVSLLKKEAKHVYFLNLIKHDINMLMSCRKTIILIQYNFMWGRGNERSKILCFAKNIAMMTKCIELRRNLMKMFSVKKLVCCGHHKTFFCLNQRR